MFCNNQVCLSFLNFHFFLSSFHANKYVIAGGSASSLSDSSFFSSTGGASLATFFFLPDIKENEIRKYHLCVTWRDEIRNAEILDPAGLAPIVDTLVEKGL